MNNGMMNTEVMEKGSGSAILDPKDYPNFVGGEVAKTEDVLAREAEAARIAKELETPTETEEEKLAGEAAETPEQKQAAIEAKIAEDNKEKTPEEITALQEASRDTRTPEEKLAEEEKVKNEEAEANRKLIEDNALKAMLKRHGVTSEEELAEKLNPKVETEEQKKAAAENYTASLNQYAVKSGVFTNDEITTLANLKKMAPHDLVYNQFKKEYEGKFAGRLNDDKTPNPVTDDEVRDNFNEFFNIESENEALKEQGQKALELRAKNIIAPMEEKYNDLKEVFDTDNRKTAALPTYAKFVQSALTEFVPKEMTFGEGDETVKVTLNNTDLKALEAMFVKNHYFEDFLQNGGTAEQRAEFKKEIEKEIYWQNRDAIAKVVGDVRHSAGVKLGAVGAKAPFEEQNRTEAAVVDTDTLTPAEQEKLRKSFKQR